MIEVPQIDPFLGNMIQPVLVDGRVEGPGGYGFPAPAGTASGGGWWQLTVSGMTMSLPHETKMLRAFAARVAGGQRIRVQIWDEDQRLAPLPASVPFADGSSFDDGGLFAGGAVSAKLSASAMLRDDEVVIEIASGQTLVGGELFSLERSLDKGPELHLITSVEAQEGQAFTVRISPTLRQDHPVGAECNFDRPAFAATIPDTSTLWPEYGVNKLGEASVTFVEAP